MRLRQIKLAGFKSFADPALIEFQHPVVGIVGPNGCGKSNIIDAVRWVLGEARVSELRGSASMKELIFAGSTSRRSLGRASVELILQNDDGRLKGAWQTFSEISVKRVVTSDGHSTYFINHQQVRRRDVQDIFLGTGLGPRSYAIISQGMITNFIRARPEDMRVYLEEAAGVSLYRERRRETETLLNQTRGNLERVRDLQSVKAEEAARLETEAEVARRWQSLTKEKTAAESLWYWIQFDDVVQTLMRLDAEIARGEADIEARKADAVAAGLMIPGLTTRVDEAQAKETEANAALRQAERALTQAEAELKRLQERRRLAEAALTRARTTLAAKEEALRNNAVVLARNDTEMAALRSAEAEDEEATAAAEEMLYEAEDALVDANARATDARRRESEAKAQAKVAVARAEAAVRRADDLKKRLLRLGEDESKLSVPDPGLLEALRADLEEAEAVAEERRAELETCALGADTARADREQANEAYFSALAAQKAASARLEALEAIQKKAEAGGKLAEFEVQEGLDGFPRLADCLSTDPEWVTAAEAVLGSHAAAKCLRHLEAGIAFEEKRPPAMLGFVEKGGELSTPVSLTMGGQTFEPLLVHVTLTDDDAAGAVIDRLGGVYCARALRDALRVRQALPEGVTLVTPRGDRVTRSTLAVWASDDPGLSLLSRQQEITSVRERLYALEDELGVLDEARRNAQQRADVAVREAKLAAERSRAAESEVTKVRLSLKTREAERTAYEQRLADLRRNRSELEEEVEEALAMADDANAAADEAEESADKVVKAAVSVLSQATRAEQNCQARRTALTALRHRREMASVKLAQLRDARRLLEEGGRTLSDDVEAEKTRIREAEAILEETDRVSDDASRGEALKALTSAEEAYRAACGATQAAREALASQQARHSDAQSAVMPMTEALGVKRVERQMKESLRTQFSDRLDELGADRTALAREAAERPLKAQSVRSKVLKLISEIAGLGPVNHAALEHLEAVRRTLEATARQVEDLEKGISTLEEAIRKIDAETRERLRETFDEVNGYFVDTFTELFGGGHAELVMTGEDVLNAGIEVKAQPPGKKNSTVRQLSGGEQALTATALVFAIFRLNPAPFCLLDEVDAPLDEANQARLAGLCRKMSEDTQFIMITHHRVTMEFAGALIGVTMKEAGVSRVVSVDVENAVRIAGE